MELVATLTSTNNAYPGFLQKPTIISFSGHWYKVSTCNVSIEYNSFKQYANPSCSSSTYSLWHSCKIRSFTMRAAVSAVLAAAMGIVVLVRNGLHCALHSTIQQESTSLSNKKGPLRLHITAPTVTIKWALLARSKRESTPANKLRWEQEFLSLEGLTLSNETHSTEEIDRETPDRRKTQLQHKTITLMGLQQICFAEWNREEPLRLYTRKSPAYIQQTKWGGSWRR